MGAATGNAGHAPNGLASGWDLVAALRSQIHQVHRLLDDQVSAAAARTQSAPVANAAVVSLYVHALCVEDATVNGLLRNNRPLFTSIWIGGRLQPWDLTTMRGYAEVVYTTTDVLLDRLTAADLRSSVDLSDAGLGHADVGWVLNRFVLWETAIICGELAAAAVARSGAAVSPRAERANGVASRNGRAHGASLDLREEAQAQNTRRQLVARNGRSRQ
jgi:hypothetical protein